MTNTNVLRLPAYPSTNTRKSLSPSQLATINETISSSLLQTLALPPTKRDTQATRTFLSTYAKDTALQVLQSLIWESPSKSSKDDKTIRKRALLLAEKLAASPPGLDIQTLLDLAIIYAPTNVSLTRTIFLSAFQSTPSLASTIQIELVPAFTLLLSPSHSSGLYGLRKVAHCISSLLHISPPELNRPFAHNKPLILALANAYDQGLATIAHSYGGMHVQQAESRELDEWERIWVETKVSLMDAFHVLLTSLLNDISAASGQGLAAESERTFDIIFNLLEVPSSTPSQNTPPTPFLNRSLLADYQQSYNLSHTLASALRHAAEKDARLDLLESTLRSPDTTPSESQTGKKDAGALKLLLRSSGVPPGIDNLGKGKGGYNTANKPDKGKAKAKVTSNNPSPIPSRPFTPLHTPIPSSSNADNDPDIDMKITQVLDILPEHSPDYIRALLVHPAYPFKGSAEKVVEALLEGTAPGQEELERDAKRGDLDTREEYNLNERRNVFDDDAMDLAQVHVGKKRGEDETSVLRDRTFIEQMKADILRRAEAISDDEEEEEERHVTSGGKGKKPATVAFEDELDPDGVEVGRVKVVGDGEESDGDDEGDDDDEDGGEGAAPTPPPRQPPETILELAYIRDPKLFERDGATRRGKARADLKAQTGWDNEQIEGWRIMLERNPRKDKILQKHEFAGNRAVAVVAGPSGDQGHGPPRGGGRGRGRGGAGRGGRGGGRGRGGGSGEGGDDGGSARERAWNDKNKASRANHNRKRGHDKKMARAGGPSA